MVKHGEDTPPPGGGGRSTGDDVEVESKLNGVVERMEASGCVDRCGGDIGEVLTDRNLMDKSTEEKSSLPSIEDDSTCSSVESLANADSMETDVSLEGEKNLNREPFAGMVGKEGEEKRGERISTRPRRRASSAVKAKSSRQVSVVSVASISSSHMVTCNPVKVMCVHT